MSGGASLLVRLGILLVIILGATLTLLSLARSLEPAQPSVLIDPVRADWQQCVRVDPGPLKPRTRPVLNPHQSEIV